METLAINSDTWAQIITIVLGVTAAWWGKYRTKLTAIKDLIVDIDNVMQDGQVSDSELQAIINSAKKVAGIKSAP